MKSVTRSDRIGALVELRRREAPDIPLDGMEIFARARELTRLSRHWIEPVFDRHGLDTGEFDVLATFERAGAPYSMRPTELFRALVMTSGGMTDRLARLTAKGLVRRTPSATDRRSLLVELTEHGLASIRRAYAADMTVEKELLAAIGAEDRDRLAELLALLLKSMEARQASETAGASGE